MKLNLTDVLLDGRRIETEVPIGLERLDFSFGSFPVREKSAAVIQVAKGLQGFLEIQGRASLKVMIPCDRCLDDVEVPLELDFTEKIPVPGEDSPENPDEGQERDDEDGSSFAPDYYLEGYHLDVDKLLFGEALLSWPSRVLCKEDCKGLCPVCGQNLNHGDCGCERKALDPRMAKVLDVFSKFKEV